MKTILVAGVKHQPFGSFPAASQSNDGLEWDNPSSPFEVNDHCTALATDGSIVAISDDKGYLSVSTNMVNFSAVELSDGFGTKDIIYTNGHWIAVGSRIYQDNEGPYEALSEVSQIYHSTSAYGPWNMVWTNGQLDSRFYQVRYFNNAPVNGHYLNVTIAVGSHKASGDAWYSLDYGFSWTRVILPEGVKTIYSVNLYQLDGTTTWIWGCRDKVFYSERLDSPVWTQIPLSTGDTAINIEVDQNNFLLINGSNAIYRSINGLDFTKWTQPGYVFDHIIWIDLGGSSRWFAFARSNLTQYTMWLTDDLITWTPLNNGIHVQGVAVIG